MSDELPSPGEFESSLTPELLRPLQIVSLALPGSALFFAVVVAVLPLGATQQDPNLQTLWLLSLLNAVLLPGCLAASFVVPRAMQSGPAFTKAAQQGTDALVGLFRGAQILRLALLEGPAMFGLVVVLVARLQGALGAQPLLWLNALSLLPLLGVALATLPTPRTLREWYETRLRTCGA